MPLNEGLIEKLKLLGNKQHLQRQKGLEWLHAVVVRESHDLDMADEGTAEAVVALLMGMFESERWEDRLGAFLGFTEIVAVHRLEPLVSALIEQCMRFLEDREPRVRLAVADLLGVLSRLEGLSVPERCVDRVVRSIKENFDRDVSEPSSQLAQGDSAKDTGAAEGEDDDMVADLLGAAYTTQRPGQGEMRHGTEGWKALETSCRSLQRMMEGTGTAFRPLVSDDLRQLVYRTLKHPNRFVRESGYFAVGAMVETFTAESMDELCVEVAEQLRDGLSDNWSQVRFAASTASRKFMLAAGEAVRARVYPITLPPMCLNRYYVAEGVRLFSQETWKAVVGTSGKDLVTRYIDNIVPYYIEQSKANNHAVREAACACMAELMAKVHRDAVAPHASRMLRALVNCFKDDSWPVRDAACTACGRCVAACPEESREVLEELKELWKAHLWDNIPSVRENSANAMAKAAKAYGDEMLAFCWAAVDEFLPRAFDQPSESQKYTGLDNITSFGVAGVRRIRANDLDLHTNQTMFSCGSLAPKLQRGGGCMDHGFKRPQEPWEATDGAVHLAAELSELDPAGTEARLSLLSRLAGIDSFIHAYALRETIFKALPRVARAVGKRAFKPHLEELLTPLFRSLSCGHQLAEHAAGMCLGAIRDMIGPNILAGRLDDEQLRLLNTSPLIPPSSFGAPAGTGQGIGGAQGPGMLRVQ